jgi:tripeptide aminopeptidase
MVNAIKGAAAFIERLPRDHDSPETTQGRAGFVHPYQLEAGVAQATLKVLLRDFDTPRLRDHERLLRQLADEVMRSQPGLQIDCQVTAQYRNLGDGLAREPRAVAYAERAHERLGVPCERSIIRGGTDGSRLTELGLPTPNLSSGQHNPHSNLEWACLDEMEQAVQVLTELVQLWAQATP